MRSAQENSSSLEKVGAARDLLGVKTEAQSSQSLQNSVSSIASTILGTFPGTQSLIWEKGVPQVTFESETETLEARAAKAEAWESQAFEAQRRRSSQFQRASASGSEASVVLCKKSSLKKMLEEPEQEESKVLSTRPLWSNKAEYILAVVGFSLRPLNLWRFPYLWLHSGGLTFFIIYTFLLFLVGIPLLFLEMAVGRRMRQYSFGAWKLTGPWFGGVVYSTFMVCFVVGSYINVSSAWVLSYLTQSFQFPIPWEHCPLLKNASDFDPECIQISPSIYFWYRLTLKASDRIEDVGPPVLRLFLPLFLSWCLVGAFMVNGITCIGKVMYVLVPMPGVIMVCLLIRGVLLNGAAYGFQRMSFVEIPAVYSFNVWRQAGVQVLLALGLGIGPMVILSSYVDQSSSCLSDAFAVALVNLGCTMLATPLIFCVLGVWATKLMHRCSEKSAEIISKLVVQGKLPTEALPPLNLQEDPVNIFNSWLIKLPQPIRSQVHTHITECDLDKQFLKVKEAPTFAFLAFIQTMSFIPGSVFWTILFFLMILALGLNFEMGVLQGILTPLQDTFPSFRKHGKLLTVVVFGFLFLCGLFFLRPSGIYYIKLLSDYWMILPRISIIIFENMAVCWIYGSRRFLTDLGTLWGRSIHPIFHWLWCYVSPVVLLVLFITTLIFMSTGTFTYVAWDSTSSEEVLRPYPSWGLLVMIFFLLIFMLPIPTYFLYSYTHGIPFKPTGMDGSLISSMSLDRSIDLTPSKESQKEEGYSDNEMAELPAV